MIKLRKKTLSVLLCLTLLASVIVVGFVTPAMALTSTAETPSNRSYKINFESEDVGTFAPEGLYKNKVASTSCVIKEESDGNKYLEIKSSGSGTRVFWSGLDLLKSNKKYYIAFDAKATTDAATFDLAIGDKKATAGAAPTFILKFNDTYNKDRRDEALADSGSKFYVGGEPATGYDAFSAALSTQWQSFGMVLSFDMSIWDPRENVETDTTLTALNYPNSAAATTSSYGKYWYWGEGYGGNYLMLGAGSSQTVYYDNIVIYEMDVYDDAVPEFQYGETQEVTKYDSLCDKDMESLTESDYTFKAYSTAIAGSATVGTDSDPDHNKVLNINNSGYVKFNNNAVFVSGKKYIISFDAKGTGATGIYIAIGRDVDGMNSPQVKIVAAGGGGAIQTSALYGAFKFYIDGVEETSAIKVSKDTWKSYRIEFDYTNADFIASNTLSSAARTIWFGAYYNNADAALSIDNLKIETVTTETVEIGNDAGDTYISNRNHQDNPFVSAGLRFMNSLPTTTVEAADEIGFVVAPSTLAAKAENKDNWYKLDGDLNSIARKAVCKDADNGINIVYNEEGGRTYYQLVLTGLSTENEANTAYSRRFSTVMYVKKDGVYSYYALGEYSYNQVDAIAYVLGIKN